MAGASEEGDKARGGTSDAAVRSKTGKSWQEWFTILDQAGAMEMDHKGIVGYLKENHSISPWWQQHVTVAYEQERGLRQVHEMPEGYQISRSKTINASLSSLYAAWLEAELRNKWFGDVAFDIRSARKEKSLRLTWDEQPGSVEVAFSSKGQGKSQVTVQHSKLDTSERAEEMKDYWARALARLKDFLEELG
jgi:uncharacterized protein YndB with AHSA1/START domain